MMTISKPLSAAQLRSYHAEEFSNAHGNYYTEDDHIQGQWHGRLADQWGLAGAVREEHLHRLADGNHPITRTRLVRRQASRSYTNQHGESVKTMEHRAGWDLTLSAPKSVSITALVGGDGRIAAAHRASVRVALDETERFIQARLGRNQPAETTGKWIAAAFEHDSARPVDGYAAPQLHTHVIVLNVTERQNGETRALQPRELYRTQQYATAVYRSELARRLADLGYETERGSSDQPEITGYTDAYLEASSPRRQQIKERLESEQRRGAAAAQIAAHQTREPKLDISHRDMQRKHRAMARAFGDQPRHVIQAAKHRQAEGHQHEPQTTAPIAMTFAQDRNFEREAVVDERALVMDALRRSMGEVTVGAVQAEFAQRIETGGLVPIDSLPGAVSRLFTSREMLALEEDTIQRMRQGQQTAPPLLTHVTRGEIDGAYAHLNEGQRVAIQKISANCDQVQALEGVAGAGKTTALTAIREGAEREGYRVEGLAPTSRAAQKLVEAGIASNTLQRFIATREVQSDGRAGLYVLDESSLASTKQMNAFLQRLTPQDRVLLVGDVRQHQAVEAGRPYQQLQEAGIHIARLDGIVRQREPWLKQIVEHLSRGEVSAAIHQLDQHGRVIEIPGRNDRLNAIAKNYVTDPDGTLVVSPDNQSRIDINAIIHGLMQSSGRAEVLERKVRVLVPRNDVTGADRKWAEQYAVNDFVRYTTGSRPLGLRAGEYARVLHVNGRDNHVTVARRDGECITYDPVRLKGVLLFREAERTFASGDRVQFTLPYRALKIANRELGTIQKIRASGDLELQLDSGRSIRFNVTDHPHLDYGYAVTSHSSQGQTTDRVLVHVDTAQLGERLVNQRLAYVALSRGRYDAQIYTNNKGQLAQALGRHVSHPSAIEMKTSDTQQIEPAPAVRHPAEHTIAR